MTQATTADVADLARILALTADAIAQNLDGTMDDRTAAGHLHGLNNQASALMRKLGG